MSAINDCGPAFPVQDASKWQCHGMTLRDYFAAKAMQGFVSNRDASSATDKEIAFAAYEMADAMLRARQAKP